MTRWWPWVWKNKDKTEHEVGDMEPRMTPSSLTDDSLRKLARRRGYRAHKVRKHDWWYLVDRDGSRVNANEHALSEEERYFSKAQLEEFLRAEEPK